MELRDVRFGYEAGSRGAARDRPGAGAGDGHRGRRAVGQRQVHAGAAAAAVLRPDPRLGRSSAASTCARSAARSCTGRSPSSSRTSGCCARRSRTTSRSRSRTPTATTWSAPPGWRASTTAILELPRGYDSVIGEDAGLSGGEAQRISIARALLADAPVLVLDEATAFADPQTEQAVRRGAGDARGRPDDPGHRPPPGDDRRRRHRRDAGATARSSSAARPPNCSRGTASSPRSGRSRRSAGAGTDAEPMRRRRGPMIRMLLRVLGHEYARPVRRTVALMTATAIAEGLSYALLVPVLRALFGSTPEDARPWLVAFGAAVAVYAVLRYVSDLSGFRVGTTLLRGMYHRLGDHLARLPIGWYNAGRVGEVSVLASRGVLQAMSVIAHLLAPFISACVTPLTIVVVMLAFNWQMGLAALAAVPVVAAIQVWTGRATAADRRGARRTRPARPPGGSSSTSRPSRCCAPAAGPPNASGLLDDSLQEVQRASRRSTLSALPGVRGPDAHRAGDVHRAAGPGRLPRARRGHRRGGGPDDPGARRPLRRSAAVAAGYRRQTPRRAFRTGQARRRCCAPSRCRSLASRSSRPATTWSSTPSPSGTATARCSTACRCPYPRASGSPSSGRRARARARCCSCSRGSTTWTRARCASAAWTCARSTPRR